MPADFDYGFTRGFASSQAYERRFPGERNILPKNGKRKILFQFFEECAADPTVFIDVFAYDLSNPEIVRRLKDFGPRLRIVIDNSDKHGEPGSDEDDAEAGLIDSAGKENVKR